MPEPHDPALDTALRVLQTAVDMPRDWDARLTPVQAAAVLRERDALLARLQSAWPRIVAPTLAGVFVCDHSGSIELPEDHGPPYCSRCGHRFPTPAAGIAAAPTPRD